MIVAEGNKLFIVTGREKHRVGQIILQHTKGDKVAVIDFYNTPLDRDKLINDLLIGEDDFYQLLALKNYEKLLNVPLYSKDYYQGLPFKSVKKKPIPFDFIQIQSKAIIFAQNGEVKVIGSIDELASYLLLNAGLIISDDVVVKGIKYAVEHGYRVTNTRHPLVQVYLALKRKYGEIKFEWVRREEDYYVISTNIGYFYLKDGFVTNFKRLVKLFDKLPIKTGFVSRTPYGNEVSYFTFDEDIELEIEIIDKRPKPYFTVGGEKFYLDGKISLKDMVIIGEKPYKFRAKNTIIHKGVVDFVFEGHNILAKSNVVIDGREMEILEDAEAFELGEGMELKKCYDKYIIDDVLDNSPLLRSFNFSVDDDGVSYALADFEGRSYLITYGCGKIRDLRGVMNIYGNYALIDGISPRVYRVVRIDDFRPRKYFEISGEWKKRVRTYVKLLELKMIAELYRVRVEVGFSENGEGVKVTFDWDEDNRTINMLLEEFENWQVKFERGVFKIGGDFKLPTDKEWKKVYSIAIDNGRTVEWIVLKPRDIPNFRFSESYVYNNGMISFEGRKIEIVFKPKTGKEVCFTDFMNRTVCMPIVKQMTLF